MSTRTPFGDSAVSPPASVTPNFSARLIRPRANRPTQDCGKSRGKARDRNAATGSPPMAAISLSPRVRQRCPTVSGGCQSRRKWIPSRVKSVVTRDSCPGTRPSTAQSSPIPVMTERFEPRARPPVEDFAMRRIWAIKAFSGSGTAQYYTASNQMEQRGPRCTRFSQPRESLPPQPHGKSSSNRPWSEWPGFPTFLAKRQSRGVSLGRADYPPSVTHGGLVQR